MLKQSLLATALGCAALVSTQACALNIVLTNDDSWSTANIQALKTALVADGHSVLVSAPCTQESGKGGAMNIMKAVPVQTKSDDPDQFCVGDTDTSLAFSTFSEGTPVMAALYGIDVAAKAKWGSAPDLVISGPNEGNNLGYLNNNSGTLGATMVMLARGIPAIAVSAGTSSGSDSSQAPKISNIVVKLVDQLVSTRPANLPLLPPHLGLNVNIPDAIDSNLGFKLTDVGWNGGGTELAFSADMSSSDLIMQYVAQSLVAAGYASDLQSALAMAKAMYAGKAGLTMQQGDAGDSAEVSEGVAVGQGYVTISTIDGSIQASRAQQAYAQQRLAGLGQ